MLIETGGSNTMPDSFDPPQMSGPLRNPIDRYLHLPEKTRRFFEELRSDDIDDIRAALKFARAIQPIHRSLGDMRPEDFERLVKMADDYDAAKMIGRFGRWLAMAVGAFFLGSLAFGKQVVDLIASIKGLSK